MADEPDPIVELLKQATALAAARQADATAKIAAATDAVTATTDQISVGKEGMDDDVLTVFNTGVLTLQVLAINLQQMRLLKTISDKLDALKPVEAVADGT